MRVVVDANIAFRSIAGSGGDLRRALRRLREREF